MKATKQIEDFMKVKKASLDISIFSGNLKQNILLWVADQLPEKPTGEEKAFLEKYIDDVNQKISKLMSGLQVGRRVTILKSGKYQGETGVITDIQGPPNDPDKTKIQYLVRIEEAEEAFLAFELEPKNMPKGAIAPAWRSPGPPFTPPNRPRL